MMNQTEQLDQLLNVIELSPNPATHLQLIDKLIQQKHEMGSHFVLHDNFLYLKPAIENFTNDTKGFVKFVLKVRDAYGRGENRRHDVQQFYRVLVIRTIQDERRKRLNKAVEKAIQMGKIDNHPKSKQLYQQKCVYAWSQARDAVLDAHRTSMNSKRLSLEEQELLLEKFWQGIDARIEIGDIPAP